MAAGAGTYPKPDSERVGAKRQAFEWTNLPKSGYKGSIPPMPVGYFSQEAQDKWEELWRLPQAYMWDNPDIVQKYIYLYSDFIVADKKAPLAAQMSGCEDRLGLSPKALLQLRWRIVPDNRADPKFVNGEDLEDSAPLAIVKELPKQEIDFDA